MHPIFTLFLTILVLTACVPPNGDDKTPMADINPLLKPWEGPYGGVPAFDDMVLADLEPAYRQAIDASLAEYEAIAANPAAPTFENTIEAMEISNPEYDRVAVYYSVWRSNVSSPEFRDVQARLTPMIADYFSAFRQNRALFERVTAVYESPELTRRSKSDQRLVEQIYLGFALNGSTLGDDEQQRYASINSRLAELQTQFSNNVLADEEAYVLYLDADQLSGLPESFVNSARAAAKQRDQSDKFAVTNTRSSVDPFLTFSDDRELRQIAWRTFYSRGDLGDANDNNAIITEILRLRQERVQLLGYQNYAEWRLSNRMAGKPEHALDLMQAVWPAAIARVAEEVRDMQVIANSLGHDVKIAPWDYRYYAEKVRQSRYELDSNEVKQYLQLSKLREAMFHVAGELFGFAFSEITDGSVPVFHPDVRVWEVTDRESGAHIAVWYLDPFARPGKRSGAWATSYRGHTSFAGKQTVLGSNNSNFIKSDPVLVSWSDAETFFHEFGHALHYFSSAARYPTQNIGVRDYVEFQSQLLERWLMTDTVINNYLVHHKTGEPIPPTLVAKIRKAATFNQGFATTEYLASAMLDMMYHMADSQNIDPDTFEREALAKLNMPEELEMRHRSTHFGHIFNSESYAAGYYGYLWADVLTSDAAEAFAQAPDGFYDANVAERMVNFLFAPRNMLDPAAAYRQFRGRDADIQPLMRDRGFIE